MKNDPVSIIKRQIRNGFSWYGGDYVVCMIAKKIYQELNEQSKQWTLNPAGIPAPVGAWIMNEGSGGLIKIVKLMVAIEDAAQQCPDCCTGAFCAKHDGQFWDLWDKVRENLANADITTIP